LATYYSLDEMISWSPEEAHIHIKDVLVDLSDPARALMAGP
jgi:hypothetical protein